MSTDEQTAAIGKLIMERKAARQHLQLLRSEARRRGEAMVRLGQHLQTSPEQVQFYGLASESQYRVTLDNIDPKDFDMAKLMQTVHDIWTETSRLQDLDAELSNLDL